MKFLSVRINGFRNIDTVEIKFDDSITSLVALNSYGKSNVLNAIMYAVDFIKDDTSEKQRKMSNTYGIPLNQILSLKNFSADMTFLMENHSKLYQVNYGFEFSWAKNNNKMDGCKVVSEWLTIRLEEKYQKPYRIIKREDGKAFYKSSETGRCTTHISVSDNELIINKLMSIEGFYYREIIEQLNNIKMLVERDFDASKKYRSFPIILSEVDEIGSSIDLSYVNNIPKIVYTLKERYPNSYSVLIDAFLQLFPNVLNVVVKEIDLGEKSNIKISGDVPYIVSNKVYAMFVTDKNLNQPINFTSLSDGAKRVFLMLAYTIIANINGYHLIAFEEPENSIHPNLLQSYLSVLSQLAGDCRIIISSHSPYIMQCVKTEDIYIGIPNDDGIADFARIDKRRVDSLLTDASDNGDSVGNYIFDLLSGGEDDTEFLLSYLEQ